MIYHSRVLFSVIFLVITSGCVSNPGIETTTTKTTTTTVHVEEKVKVSEPVKTLVIIENTKADNNDAVIKDTIKIDKSHIKETIIIKEMNNNDVVNVINKEDEETPEKLKGMKKLSDENEDFSDL